MDLNTNDYNVAKLQVAWEICKNIDPGEGIEGQSYREKSEKFAYKLAQTVAKVLSELTPRG